MKHFQEQPFKKNNYMLDTFFDKTNSVRKLNKSVFILLQNLKTHTFLLNSFLNTHTF